MASGSCTAKADFFGEVSGAWDLPPYQFPAILHDNVIFCSAIFRRSDWAKVNGYNPNMIYGWEDYDFWLSLIELGREVFCISETLFSYRKRPDSMTTKMTLEEATYSYTQLFRNHSKLYADNMGVLLVNLAEMTHQRIARLEALVHEKDQHVAQLEAIVRNQDQLITDLQSSLSWKMTKPLRYAKAVCRKCLKRRK